MNSSCYACLVPKRGASADCSATIATTCITLTLANMLTVIVWFDIALINEWCDLRLDHWRARRKHGVSLLRLVRYKAPTIACPAPARSRPTSKRHNGYRA
jgi:hypothetical protein